MSTVNDMTRRTSHDVRPYDVIACACLLARKQKAHLNMLGQNDIASVVGNGHRGQFRCTYVDDIVERIALSTEVFGSLVRVAVDLSMAGNKRMTRNAFRSSSAQDAWKLFGDTIPLHSMLLRKNLQ